MIQKLRYFIKAFHKHFRLIEQSGLFNKKFYLEKNQLINKETIDPLVHFFCDGAREGRNPNPLFSVSYYLNNNPELTEKGINPLAHYLILGAIQGKDPHPLFDTSYYYKERPEAKTSGLNALVHYFQASDKAVSPHPLFDRNFYQDQNPDVVAAGIDPLIHYIWYGAGEGRDPNPLFDTKYYFDNNLKLRDSEINPLAHYVEIGWKEGKDPHPLFDTAYYYSQCPDAKLSGSNALAHYFKNTDRSITSHPLFDPIYYLEQHPEADKVDSKPILHYIHLGAKKRNDPHPFFDTNYYLKKSSNSDHFVENPLIHYILYGVKQGIDPHPFFDTSYFLCHNSEVRDSGMNPLVHYTLFGAIEGRDTFPVVEKLDYRPKITIIAPLTNFDETLIIKGMESILSQKYDNWEICLAGHQKIKILIETILKNAFEDNQKISIKWLENDTNEADLINEAIGISSDGFLLFFNMIDELTPNALLEVVRLLNHSKDVDVIYSDEDKLDESGNIFDPIFKPNWSLELFRQTRFAGQMVFIRRSVVKQTGQLDRKFSPIHIEEYFLRIVEHTQRIHHLDKVLYHQRQLPSEKDSGQNMHLWQNAVDAHLKRLNLPGHAKIDEENLYVNICPKKRITFPLVSIILFDVNEDKLIKQFIKNLYDVTDYPNFEVILVGSVKSQMVLDYQKTDPVRVLRYKKLFHLSDALNDAAKHTKGEYVAFIESQTRFPKSSWIQDLLYYTEQTDIGIAGYSDKNGFPYDYFKRCRIKCDKSLFYLKAPVMEKTAVPKSFMMIRKKLFNDFGGFNSNYYKDIFDVDLCFRLRKKEFRIIQLKPEINQANTAHVHEQHMDEIDRFLFLDQWQDVIEMGDPYYRTGFDAVDKSPLAKLIRH